MALVHGLLVGLACLALTACSGGGGGGGGTTSVTVSGRITFERVPFSTTLGRGLSYTATFEAPAREVEVDLVQSSNQAILATTATDLSGNYSFIAPINTNVVVRAKALTRHSGTAARPASWDLRVRNNTNGNALYVLDSSVFNTSTTNQTRNLKAASGWGGSLYIGTRAAAPFAVLDTLYEAVQFVITQGDSTVQLAGDRALTAYWSDNNVPSDGDVSAGQIGTTAYYPRDTAGVSPGIYVLGAASNDTDEFDTHVVAHEFLHYLEDVISRTDTVGGPHSLDEWLDMRVAFSEGYGNAFSAMVQDDPLYRDSFGTAQATDFSFNIESRATSAPGWYSETSVQRILWDLFDSVNDGADAVSTGYGPMHQVFMSALRNDVPLTSLFSFITALKQNLGGSAVLVNQLVEAENIPGTSLGIVSTSMDAYATTETHSGVLLASSDLVLPIYTPVTLNGPAVRVCAADRIATRDGVIEGAYNKLGNRRFLRLNVPSARNIRITVSCSAADADCGGLPVPDPDFVLTRASDITYAESSTPRLEELAFGATTGDYVLEVYEWTHVDLEETSPRGRTCMTVNITG